MKPYLIVLALAFSINAGAQKNKEIAIADSLYNAGKWIESAVAYDQATATLPAYQNPKALLFNAACSYALAGDKDKAFAALEKAVYQHGYRNLDHMLVDEDIESLRSDKRWDAIVSFLKDQREAMRDPRKARVVTSDIHNFWEAFDLAKKDTANRYAIFQKHYFEKGSPGLKDYFWLKIGTINQFVNNQRKKPEFYEAIRKNTLEVEKLKDSMYIYFDKLKELYDDAVFPDMYFVIGRWNSAGTVSDAGLLLGVDQIARTPEIPQHELTLWEKNNFTDFSRLPVIAMHEQIHFQQSKIEYDTTLLWNALIEGMADFVCELVTGKNPSQRQHEFAATRKKEIWERFKSEMYLRRSYNWIANSDQERPDHPADLGYYMGYEICKAYYDKATDKKQAIRDMLELKDPKQFLEKSGYEELMNALP